MNNTPENSLQRIRFCALAGTEAKIQGDVIAGRWKSPPVTYYGPRGGRLLIAEFLNWPSEQKDILRFIRKFGPLFNSPAVTDFTVTHLVWSRWKDVFRELWEGLMEEPEGFEFESGVNNALLTYVSRKFEFRVDYLATFLELELASTDRCRLRKCLAPDCSTPYFVARHLKQKYCDEVCAQWAQAEWKRKWWAENGKDWREQHRPRRRPSRNK